jgi:two-component sensor histidine kinase
LGLKLNGEEILYEISDNGPGIPTNLDYSKTKSLGFKLLSIFVKQLKGKYELINDNGLQILIRFKNDTENFNS